MNKTVPLPPVLIKIGKREHIERFVNEGIMRFGTYAEYRKQEEFEKKATSDTVRKDELEGLEKQFKGELKLNIRDRIISFPDSTLNFFQNKYSHLFCMFGFAHKLPIDFKMDKRMQKFGDTAVIFNSKVFLTQIGNLLSNTNFDMDYVKYYPEDIFPYNLGPYSKRYGYSYQYEYRIATNLANEFLTFGEILANRKDTLIIPSSELTRLRYDIEA